MIWESCGQIEVVAILGDGDGQEEAVALSSATQDNECDARKSYEDEAHDYRDKRLYLGSEES